MKSISWDQILQSDILSIVTIHNAQDTSKVLLTLIGTQYDDELEGVERERQRELINYEESKSAVMSCSYISWC